MGRSSVVAVAGRRFTAESRDTLPPGTSAVVAALERWLTLHEARAVVASASRGADLLALCAARKLGIRTRIVLPGESDRFRARSVTDQGMAWASMFDAAIDDAATRQDVVVLSEHELSQEAFEATNAQLIRETIALSSLVSDTPRGLAIWDGSSRVEGFDATADFVARIVGEGWPCDALDPAGLGRR